jgi:hypothetical protein
MRRLKNKRQQKAIKRQREAEERAQQQQQQQHDGREMPQLPGGHGDVQQPEEPQHTGPKSTIHMPQQQPRQGRSASSGKGMAEYVNLDTLTSRQLWELFYDTQARLRDLAQLHKKPGYGNVGGEVMLRSHLIRDQNLVYGAILRKYLHETPPGSEGVRVQGTAYVGNEIKQEDTRQDAYDALFDFYDDYPFEYPEDAFPPQ